MDRKTLAYKPASTLSPHPGTPPARLLETSGAWSGERHKPDRPEVERAKTKRARIAYPVCLMGREPSFRPYHDRHARRLTVRASEQPDFSTRP